MISYQLAYVESALSTCFLYCAFSGVWNNHEKLAHHLRECKEAGYEILPPSLSKSEIAVFD